MSGLEFVPHLIDGQERESGTGARFDNVDPWTRSVRATVAEGGEAEARDALAAARTAFDSGPWPRMSERERSAVLHRLADLLQQHVDEFALADTLDMGRPLAATTSFDVPRSVGMFRFAADHVAMATGETYPAGSSVHAYSAFRPAGVVVAISPWNHPLMLGSWKIAAALAWGNTLVWKPAEDSPTSAFLLGRLALEAGLPPGVLNVVQGRGADVGPTLTASPLVDRITFTGSTATGRSVAGAAAANLVPVTLELGGKGATLVLDDADLELAAATTARAVFNNSGQVCLAGTRVVVQRGIAEEFSQRLAAEAQKLRVGDPFDPATDLGPLASERQFQRVSAYFDRVPEEGGRVVLGGPLDGWSFAPTIVSDVSRTGTVWREEIFGPLATVVPFDDLEEGIALANDTDYGLAATLLTESSRRAHAVAARLRSGTVWVNCYQVRDPRAPIGGPGLSGIGREGGDFSREFFTEPQAVFIQTSL